jgi:hypothetical protein
MNKQMTNKQEVLATVVVEKLAGGVYTLSLRHPSTTGCGPNSQ